MHVVVVVSEQLTNMCHVSGLNSERPESKEKADFDAVQHVQIVGSLRSRGVIRTYILIMPCLVLVY